MVILELLMDNTTNPYDTDEALAEQMKTSENLRDNLKKAEDDLVINCCLSLSLSKHIYIYIYIYTCIIHIYIYIYIYIYTCVLMISSLVMDFPLRGWRDLDWLVY